MDQKIGSASDWMSTYDRNGDGMLDVSELQDLQTRLSKQMTDNIQLTKHLNSLEQRSANHSTELKEKEATLRKALEAMDYSRTIQNELRSKMALSESNAAILSAEVRCLFLSFCLLSFCYIVSFLSSFPFFFPRTFFEAPSKGHRHNPNRSGEWFFTRFVKQQLIVFKTFIIRTMR